MWSVEGLQENSTSLQVEASHEEDVEYAIVKCKKTKNKTNTQNMLSNKCFT